MTAALLHQFTFSHYNEKVRWALDFKRIPHRRRSHLPGPHAIAITRLSGQKSVPVLCLEDGVTAGSAAIIDVLERRYPEPPLYPAAEPERAQAKEVQRWFDEEVGPHLRRAFFFALLPDSRYIAELFLIDRGALVRASYRAAFPAIRAVMKRDMAITADGAEYGRARTKEALDRVIQRAAGGGYLVGDRFGIADLTAAAILSPAFLPPQFPYPLPQPVSPFLERWCALWADHPAASWVREIYSRHRGTAMGG